MNFQKACAILKIDRREVGLMNQVFVKKKYHILALRYHPDRNKDVHADRDFKEINEAYQYLQSHPQNDETKWMSILQKIRESLNSEFLFAIYKLLREYTPLFQYIFLMEKRAIYWFSQGALKKRRQQQDNKPNFKEDVKSFFMNDDDADDDDDDDDDNNDDYENDHEQETMGKDENENEHPLENDHHNEPENENEQENENENIMVLRPFLDDVLVESVFKYTRFGNKLLIPLWHHEMEYDISGCFVVQIIPKLPSKNYWIDRHNNLHQIIEYQVAELWDCVLQEKCVEVFFGRKRLLFYPHHLQMKKKQLWKWENVGIPKINNHNVFDVSIRADIILHIHIS